MSRIFDRRVNILGAGQFLNALGGGMIIPYLPAELAKGTASAAGVGLVFALATAASAVGRLAGGEIADRSGRRTVLLAAIALRSAFFFAMAAAIWLGAPFVVVAALYIAASAPRGAIEPPSDAMIADIVPGELRPRAYARLRIARNAGWAAGPMLGGFLGAGGFPYLAGGAAVFGLVNLVQCAALLPETPHRSAAERFQLRDLVATLGDRTFALHCFATLLLFFGFAQIVVTVALDLPARLQIPVETLKWVYTLNGVMVVALQALVTRSVASFRRSRVLAAGAAVYAAGYLVIGAAPAMDLVLVGAAIVTLGELLTIPTAVALTSDLAPADRRGRYQGAYGVCLDVGHGLGQVLGGVGLAVFAATPFRFWVVVAAVCLAAGAFYLVLGPRLKARLSRTQPI